MWHTQPATCHAGSRTGRARLLKAGLFAAVTGGPDHGFPADTGPSESSVRASHIFSTGRHARGLLGHTSLFSFQGRSEDSAFSTMENNTMAKVAAKSAIP